MSMSPGGPSGSGSGGGPSGSAFPASSSTGFRYPGGSSSSAAAAGFQSQFGQSFMSTISTTSSSSALGDSFTPKMRDRQARGKDPYGSEDGSGGSDMSDGEGRLRLRPSEQGAQKEDYTSRERRERAQGFLNNPELLMMYAQSSGLTVPGARLHFMKILCGLDDESKSGRKDKHVARHSSSQYRQSSSRHDERRLEDRSTDF
ncbi:hypothetical protein QBC35DRAFT_449580 [Podospora australis]|uniref:Uncharacterized protein n=1 Tax=Podospora australis TaxID=1536484 RepID=A0AAN6WZL7_9PEZI|nr:hypothetical protein QBC35DRAFT_449580 [Podospora australis]